MIISLYRLWRPIGLIFSLVLIATAGPIRAAEVIVFAAASLKGALDEVVADWSDLTGNSVVISYASSAALARQIDAGAPAGVFISANTDWVDWLQSRDQIEPGTRVELLGNSIVLVTALDSFEAMEISPNLDLAGMLGDGRLALGLVNAAPIGIYAKAALEHLGLWSSVSGKVVQTDNARAALALVAQKEVGLGIVYATDAQADPRVSIVGVFGDETHPPIRYVGAQISEFQTLEGAKLLSYLKQDGARLFAQFGFRVAN